MKSDRIKLFHTINFIEYKIKLINQHLTTCTYSNLSSVNIRVDLEYLASYKSRHQLRHFARLVLIQLL